ncbi:MAG: transporter substrate-binding domain-containing protein, partial [Synergistaceae bacterium]|nr:transporter substrate-binding domain-containing protein [Synergistaceae bacterium]
MLRATEAAFPQARKEYFSDKIGGYAALLSRKVDAFIENRYEADYDIRNGLEGVKILPGSIGESVKISAGLSKTSAVPGLEEKFNSFIARAKSDGTIDGMIQHWVYGNAEMPDIGVPGKSDVRVVMGTTGLVVPFSFYAGNEITGFDVELARRFASSIGAELEVKVYDFGGLLMALAAGEVDIALSNLYYSPEHSEGLNFSDALYTVEPVALVREDMYSPSDTGNFSAFSGKRIGVFTGSVQYDMVRKKIPGAEIAYFDAIANVMAELTSGKIDAAAVDETIAAEFERENPGLSHMPESLGDTQTAFFFPKSKRNNPLLDEVNEYLRRVKSDGTLDELRAVWSGTDESRKVIPDYSSFPATKGTISIAVDNETPVFAYIKDGKLAGYDIDVIVRFCKERGYRPDFSVINFPGLIAAVSSGKCDMGAGGITITPERAESVRFSEPLYTVSSYLVVKKPATSQPVVTKPATSQQASTSTTPARVPKYSRLSELDGKPIGLQTGVVEWAQRVKEIFPHSQAVYYNTFADIGAALKSRKIEAFLVDEPVYNLMAAEDSSLARIDEKIGVAYDIAYCFPKTARGKKLCDEMSEYIRKLKASGELASIIAKWEGTDESAKTIPDYRNFPATNGVITMAIEGGYPPFNYYRGSEIVGSEIDIAAGFCGAYGYGLKIDAMAWDGIIPALASGKYDFAGDFAPSEEHEEVVYFSEPYVRSRSIMACLRADGKSVPVKSESPARVPKYSRLTDLDGKPIGMQPGITDWEEWAAKNLPHSKVHYYNTYPDLASALKTHKIEGFLVDSPVLALMAAEDDKLAAIDEPVGEIFGYSFAFAKTEEGRKLSDEMSSFIRKIKASGELDAVFSKWQGNDEAVKIIPDFKRLPATNGTLTFAIEGSYPPFNYYKGTDIAGIDVELAVKFCEAYGYGLNVTAVVWDAMIPGLVSGKVSFVPDFTPSDEHEEAVNFSEPYCMATSVMACLRADDSPARRVSKPSAPRRNLGSFDGKTIAIQTGTASETLVPAKLPSAKLAYYDSLSNQLTALKSGKADALATSLPPAVMMTNEDSTLEIINPPLRETYFYQMFADNEKGRRLCAEYSAFLKTLWDDGTIDALNDKWLGADESRKTVEDYSALPGTNGTMRMAVDAQFPPFVYVKDNRIVGHNIDLAVMFCKAKGYSLVVENMTLSGAIASVKTGKSDFSQSMNKTPEREENALFTSTPTIKAGNVLVALKSQEPDTEGISSLKVSDFEGKKVGLMIGSDSAKKIEDKIPGVNIMFFDSPSHILPSLRSGRIDAFYCALPTAKNIIQNHNDLAYIPEYVNTTRHTAMFPKTDKGRELCGEYADFLKTLSADGTLDSLTEKWITGTDESRQATEDYGNLPVPNGTLTMAVTEGLMPFVFVKDNRVQGYDIDLAVLFCKHKGCGLNIELTNHNGVLSSLQTGKCDFTYSVQWTEERDKTVLFSPVPNAVTGSVLVVMRDEDTRSVRTDLSAFSGKRIGVPTATSNAEIVGEVLPDAKLVYFDSPSEMLLALRQGKID